MLGISGEHAHHRPRIGRVAAHIGTYPFYAQHC